MKLFIANKTYSSWSLRPWLLLKQAEIPFEEQQFSFNDPALKQKLAPDLAVGAGAGAAATGSW